MYSVLLGYFEFGKELIEQEFKDPSLKDVSMRKIANSFGKPKSLNLLHYFAKARGKA